MTHKTSPGPDHQRFALALHWSTPRRLRPGLPTLVCAGLSRSRADASSRSAAPGPPTPVRVSASRRHARWSCHPWPWVHRRPFASGTALPHARYTGRHRVRSTDTIASAQSDASTGPRRGQWRTGALAQRRNLLEPGPRRRPSTHGRLIAPAGMVASPFGSDSPTLVCAWREDLSGEAWRLVPHWFTGTDAWRRPHVSHRRIRSRQAGPPALVLRRLIKSFSHVVIAAPQEHGPPTPIRIGTASDQGRSSVARCQTSGPPTLVCASATEPWCADGTTWAH